MTIFWIICALLILVALLFVVLPLWRSTHKSNAVLRDAANLEIFRDQSAEMDADLRNGLLTQELYEQGKRELQSRLLDEVKEEPGAVAVRNPLKALAISLALLLPLASVGLYWQIGNRSALSPEAGLASAGGVGDLRSSGALKALEDKVAQNPNDGEALLLLARAYGELERYADAARAYEKLTRFVTDEAWIWADYADMLAMVHGQHLVGPPTKLIDKALALDPNHPKALALAGSAAMERGDYAAAVRHWERLLKGLPGGSEDARMIEGGIRQARDFLAQVKGGKAPLLEQIAPAAEASQTAAPGKERISGTVMLSAALKGRVSPADTVFILARAAQGPKMPLAIVRKQVKDLPLQFTLDDSMAMAPQMKLSNFDEVVVVARISKSGNAMPETGDLQGMSGTLKPGSSGLKINIESVVQ
ncbi:MAG: c-type cytochrome biogenesis protein CcmI [Gallionellaceae bacterium]|nr:MAG: c-type cytochrome biogenesis protein CcmI [Gallionellaceae bacterium]